MNTPPSACTLLQLYRSMRAFVADTIYLAGEVLLHDKGLVLVPQVTHNSLHFILIFSGKKLAKASTPVCMIMESYIVVQRFNNRC
jgi:hypothetical protein